MKKLLLIALLCFCPTLVEAASCSSYPFTLQNNTTADATQVMSNFNTVRNCVVNNAASSGVNTDITSLTGLTTALGPSVGGTPVFIGAAGSGTANAQATASTTPTTYALTSGYRVTYVATATNTGATTLDVASSGATAVRKPSPAGLIALTGGEIVSGNTIEAIYNGTFHVLLTVDPADFNTLTTLAGGPTTDLGTIPSHNVSITGASTITAFGSTAAVTSPVYLIKFTGINTLTYNATSLIIPGLANITTAANDTAVVEYLGSGNWQVLSYTRASGAGIVSVSPLAGATGLIVANNAATPNTHTDVTANTVVMVNSSGVTVTANTVSVTINGTIVGANGIDVGALGASATYYAWLISTGSTTAGLISTSATAPTMPATYTYKMLAGAMNTSAASIFYRTRQVGNKMQYRVTAATNTAALPNIANGLAGTWSNTAPVYTTATVASNAGAVCPAITTGIEIVATNAYNNAANAGVQVAPNTSYSGGASTNPPPCSINDAAPNTILCRFNLETTTVAWTASAAGGGLFAQACELPINAN